jgi:hypothetical protein
MFVPKIGSFANIQQKSGGGQPVDKVVAGNPFKLPPRVDLPQAKPFSPLQTSAPNTLKFPDFLNRQPEINGIDKPNGGRLPLPKAPAFAGGAL